MLQILRCRPSKVTWIAYIFCGSAIFLSQILPGYAASIPSAPQYVEAMAGSNQVAVTWDPPSSNGGESSLTYTARLWTVPPPTSTPAFATCSTTNNGCVIGGLTSGSTYYVDVVAGNSAGIGGPSGARSIIPGVAGVAPNNVTASREKSGAITVKWTPLTSFSGGTFAWYAAEVFTSSEISIGSYLSRCTESSLTSSSCVIGGLKSDATYFVQVRTVSSVGSSYPSTPRYQVAGVSVATSSPSAPSTEVRLTSPQQVKVVALSKSVRVSWKAPSVTGGKTILNYSAGAFTSNGVVITTCKTLPKLFSCTIGGLKSNQKVYIGVIAKYSDAISPLSRFIPVITKK